MSFIAEFPARLRSGNTTNFARNRRLYEKLLGMWLRDAVEHTPPAVRALFARVNSLSPERVRLLATAPETFNRLFDFVSSSRAGAGRVPTDFLTGALAAEHYLATGRVPDSVNVGAQTLWTASGDYRIDTLTGDAAPNGRRCSGILIDGASAHCSFYREVAGEGPSHYDPHALDEIYSKIEAAVSSIAGRAAAFGRLLENSTVTISAERYGAGDKFSSASRSTFIGKVGMVNPHSATELDLCDALVHESTHSLLYAAELFEPLFTARPDTPAVKVQSPWSGRSLNLYAYTHACFVWYSLTLFWREYSGATATGGKYYERARRGFLSADLSAPVHGHVTDTVIGALRDMQQHARSLSAA